MNARLLLEILVGVLVALRLAQRALARRQRAAARALATGGHRCPWCSAERLVVADTLALPGDGVGGAIDLEALACRRCELRGVGVRRAPQGHVGYPMDPVAWGQLSAAIRSCPAARDRGCGCATHARYGRREADAWRGLDEVPHDGRAAFPLS